MANFEPTRWTWSHFRHHSNTSSVSDPHDFEAALFHQYPSLKSFLFSFIPFYELIYFKHSFLIYNNSFYFTQLNRIGLMFNLKINIRDYEKINIFNSKLNFHKILENHSINFNLLNYDKKLNLIESVGIMINNKSQNEFKISNQNEKDVIDIELNLDSYSTNFVNKIIDNPDLNIIF